MDECLPHGLIFNTMLESDTSKILEMIDGTDVNDTNHFSASAWRLCRIVLESAAIMPENKIKDMDALAIGFIQRIAQHVFIFEFTSYILGLLDFKRWCDPDLIPSRVKKALSRNIFSEDIAEDIRNLDDVAITSLMFYLLSGEVDKLSNIFSAPIIESIYRNGLIPFRSLCSLMATCLHDHDRFCPYLNQ